jgi:AraC-like DNA-binding protein
VNRRVRFLRFPRLEGSELGYIQSWEGAAPPDVKPVLEVTLVDVADKIISYRGEQQHIRSGLVGIRSAFEIGKLVTRRKSETRVRMLSIGDDEVLNACEGARLRPSELPTVLAYIDAPALYTKGAAVYSAAENGASVFEIQSRLADVAGEVVRVLTGRELVVAPAAPASARRIRELLHDRAFEDITLDDVAKGVSLSRTYVVQVFQRAYRVTPVEYLMKLRVAHARLLIAKGTRPIDVAHACGFCDQSHLNRWFRRVVGCTPGEYATNVGRRQRS